MDDRTMLELAAKAYGDPNVRIDHAGGRRWIGRNEDLGCDVMVTWNPRAEYADALRLAVKLHMTLRFYMGTAVAQIGVPGMPNAYEKATDHANPTAAACLAITRAAATVGKAMP